MILRVSDPWYQRSAVSPQPYHWKQGYLHLVQASLFSAPCRARVAPLAMPFCNRTAPLAAGNRTDATLTLEEPQSFHSDGTNSILFPAPILPAARSLQFCCRIIRYLIYLPWENVFVSLINLHLFFFSSGKIFLTFFCQFLCMFCT